MCHLQLYSTECSIGQDKKVSLPGSYVLPSAECGNGGGSSVFILRTNVIQEGLLTTFWEQSDQKLNEARGR